MGEITEKLVRREFLKYYLDFGKPQLIGTRGDLFRLIYDYVDKKHDFFACIEYDLSKRKLTTSLSHEMGTWKWEEEVSLRRMDSYLKAMNYCDWLNYLKSIVEKRFNVGIKINFIWEA